MFESKWGDRVPRGLFKSGLLAKSRLIKTLSRVIKPRGSVEARPRLVKPRGAIKTMLRLVEPVGGVEALLGLVKPGRTIEALLWQVKSRGTLEALLRLVESWVVSTKKDNKNLDESFKKYRFLGFSLFTVEL